MADQISITANSYRDAHYKGYTQVTVSCPCGRGGWIRLPKHHTPEQKYYKVFDGQIFYRKKVQ